MAPGVRIQTTQKTLNTPTKSIQNAHIIAWYYVLNNGYGVEGNVGMANNRNTYWDKNQIATVDKKIAKV